ncbi:uncharacterized protein FTOL_06802 [Fusarium torulosum]|uniref:Uncharacterized protein n=1 Tax=Fusarium torulosum TaxID=33205 RepID=A0AAE8SIF3_9HYPO|nr:uncharacterized protein FTOL_06802 [Fusarium torulosum]
MASPLFICSRPRILQFSPCSVVYLRISMGDTYNISGGVFNQNCGGGGGGGRGGGRGRGRGRGRGGKLTRRQAKKMKRRAESVLRRLGPGGDGTNPTNDGGGTNPTEGDGGTNPTEGDGGTNPTNGGGGTLSTTTVGDMDVDKETVQPRVSLPGVPPPKKN